jgi:hypothetical protein
MRKLFKQNEAEAVGKSNKTASKNEVVKRRIAITIERNVISVTNTTAQATPDAQAILCNLLPVSGVALEGDQSSSAIETLPGNHAQEKRKKP